MSNRPLWMHVVTDTRDDVVPFDRKLWNAMFNEPQYHSICARGDGRIIVFFRDHLPVLTVVSEDTLHDRLAELEGYYGDQVMGYAIEFGASRSNQALRHLSWCLKVAVLHCTTVA